MPFIAECSTHRTRMIVESPCANSSALVVAERILHPESDGTDGRTMQPEQTVGQMSRAQRSG